MKSVNNVLCYEDVALRICLEWLEMRLKQIKYFSHNAPPSGPQPSDQAQENVTRTIHRKHIYSILLNNTLFPVNLIAEI